MKKKMKHLENLKLELAKHADPEDEEPSELSKE